MIEKELQMKLNIFKSRMRSFVSDLRKDAESRAPLTKRYYERIARDLETEINKVEREIAQLKWVEVDG